MRPHECLSELTDQPLKRIEDLPKAVGIYALADHLGDIHYIGVTVADCFRDRIYNRHVNGSEERSHKLACNYNIGRMWRNRKCAEHVGADAKLAKVVRREFIRRYCFAACVPLDLTKHSLEVLEREILEVAPSEMTSWNRTRRRVNNLPEPRDLVDAVVEQLGLTSNEVEAIERQARLFEKYGHLELSP